MGKVLFGGVFRKAYKINYSERTVWPLFFPIAVIYLELVFIFSTDITADPWLIVGLMISGAMSGCLIFLLSSFFRQKIINRIIRVLMLL